MSKLEVNYLKDNMDEGNFYSILVWNSIKSAIIMAILILSGYALITLAHTEVQGHYMIAFIVTYLVMLYVFKARIFKRDNILATLKNMFIWLLSAVGYGAMMYVGGEIIFIGLIALGILIMVLFLSGDITLTAIFTYKDLVKWVNDEKDKEKRIRERDERERIKKEQQQTGV